MLRERARRRLRGRLERLEDRCLLDASGFAETTLICCSATTASIAHAVDIDSDGDVDLIAIDSRKRDCEIEAAFVSAGFIARSVSDGL